MLMLEEIKQKEVTGFLYSQIGYDLNDPMRALIRSTNAHYIPVGTIFEIEDDTGMVVLSGIVKKWGEIWKSTWWEVEFSELDCPGLYEIVLKYNDNKICSSGYFKAGDFVLWNETILPVAIEQMEERVGHARNRIGWNDCGAPCLRELNSHATTVIGMCDLYQNGFK